MMVTLKTCTVAECGHTSMQQQHVHCIRKKGLSGWGGGVGSLKKTIFSGLGFIVKCPNGEMSESAKPVQVDVLITCPMGYVDVWVC